MKKPLFLAVAFFAIQITSAQITGGGTAKSNTTPKSTRNHLYQSGYSTVGFVIPTGVYAEQPTKSPNGMGATFGFNGSIGKIYYIRALESLLPEGIGLGIDVTYLSARLNILNWDNYKTKGINLNFGPGIGIAGGYSLASDLSLDVFYNISPCFSVFTSSGEATTAEPLVTGGSLLNGTIHRLGARMRYNGFTMGAGIQFGEIEYDTEIEIDGNTTEGTKHFKQNSFYISIGRCF